MKAPLRVLIVDDEAPARDRLAAIVVEAKNCELLPTCGDGPEAVERIRSDRPELVFLDIQMPGLDGFGVIEEVGVRDMPPVVFVTAFDEHAIAAFEVNALDYVLKPFDRDRILASIHKVGIGKPARDAELEQRLLDLLGRAVQPPEPRIQLKSGGRTVFLAVDEIEWVETSSNYLHVHTTAEGLLVRETLKALSSRLPEGRFVRIHRKLLVRIDAIREVIPAGDGVYHLLLGTGKLLRSGRTFRAAVEALIRDSSP